MQIALCGLLCPAETKCTTTLVSSALDRGRYFSIPYVATFLDPGSCLSPGKMLGGTLSEITGQDRAHFETKTLDQRLLEIPRLQSQCWKTAAILLQCDYCDSPFNYNFSAPPVLGELVQLLCGRLLWTPRVGQSLCDSPIVEVVVESIKALARYAALRLTP